MTVKEEKTMTAFDYIMEGLNEAHQYAKGEIEPRKERVRVVVQPVPEFTGDKIKSVRTKLGLSQKGLAAFMGVSPKTVEGWEGNKFTPQGPARRLFEVLEHKPEIAAAYVKRDSPTTRKKVKRVRIRTVE